MLRINSNQLGVGLFSVSLILLGHSLFEENGLNSKTFSIICTGWILRALTASRVFETTGRKKIAPIVVSVLGAIIIALNYYSAEGTSLWLNLTGSLLIAGTSFATSALKPAATIGSAIQLVSKLLIMPSDTKHKRLYGIGYPLYTAGLLISVFVDSVSLQRTSHEQFDDFDEFSEEELEENTGSTDPRLESQRRWENVQNEVNDFSEYLVEHCAGDISEAQLEEPISGLESPKNVSEHISRQLDEFSEIDRQDEMKKNQRLRNIEASIAEIQTSSDNCDRTLGKMRASDASDASEASDASDASQEYNWQNDTGYEEGLLKTKVTALNAKLDDLTQAEENLVDRAIEMKNSFEHAHEELLDYAQAQAESLEVASAANEDLVEKLRTCEASKAGGYAKLLRTSEAATEEFQGKYEAETVKHKACQDNLQGVLQNFNDVSAEKATLDAAMGEIKDENATLHSALDVASKELIEKAALDLALDVASNELSERPRTGSISGKFKQV